MRVITSNYLKKIRDAWVSTTSEEDPVASELGSNFSLLESLVNAFDVVNMVDTDDCTTSVSGEFSITSDMAMITDGMTMYSADGYHPITGKEYAIAHITDANYVITIDGVPCGNGTGAIVSYSQLFVKRDAAWLVENTDRLIGTYHNLEDKWVNSREG